MVVLLSHFQPCSNKFQFLLRCCTAFLGLLLESVKRIDHPSEFDSVDSSVSVAVVVFNDFDHTSAAESAKRFCVGMFLANLGTIEGKPERSLDLDRKSLQILKGSTNPNNELLFMPIMLS